MAKRRRAPFERLMQFVRVGEQCWHWQQGETRGNLFRVSPDTSPITAARVMWCVVEGFPPRGWRVRRLCGNNDCVRPAHLCLRKKGEPHSFIIPSETVWAFEKKVRSNAGS